ncbi:MAG: hypothetical protein IK123_07490 [Lachnospiraceae bacterium]|nr:hypothetical protein [Lachnospiraceae bacterium]
MKTTIYLTYDDCGMKAIASGDMSGIPGGHIMFMNYAVGVVLSALYGISRVADWFCLFYFVSLTFALWAFIYKVFVLTSGLGKMKQAFLVLFSVILFSTMFFKLMAGITYTTLSAIVGIICIFYYALTDKCVTSDNIIIFLLAVLCFAIRYESFLMLAPYIIIVIGCKLCKADDKKTLFISSLPLWIAIILGIGILFCVDRTSYKGEYAYAREINQLRSELQDKSGLPTYESERELYESLGIDETEHGILNISWGLADSFTVENLQVIIDSKDVQPPSFKQLCEGILRSIGANISIWHLLTIGVLLLYLIVSGIADRSYLSELMAILLSGIVAFIESAYILRIGRDLDYRLISSFVLAFAFVCISFMYNRVLNDSKESLFKTVSYACIIILTVILCVGQIVLYRQHQEEEDSRYWMYAMEEYYMDHPEYIYLTSGLRSDEKFDIRYPKRRNFIKLNGWIGEMPEFDKAVQGEYSDVLEGLSCRDDIMVVCDRATIDLITKYLCKKENSAFIAHPLIVEVGGTNLEMWKIDRSDK